MNAPLDLPTALRALAAQASDDADDHPGAEDLAALATGTLTGFRRRAVEEHVAGCAECTAIVVDLGGEGEEEEGSWVGSGREGASSRQVEALLERARGPASPQTVAVALPARRRGAGGAWASTRPWLLAASLLCTVGLGTWVASLRSDLSVADGPRPVTEEFVLYPADTATRGGPSDPSRGAIPLGSQPVTVRFFVPGETLSLPLAVEFFDERGRRLGRCENPAIAEGNTVAVSLAQGWLPPGRYEVRLLAAGFQAPRVFRLHVE